MRNPRSRARGAFIIEFALVFVLLFALLFAAIEFGRAMFQASYAVDATRRGARMAAIVDARDADSAAWQQVNTAANPLPGTVLTVEYSATGVVSETGAFADGCNGRGYCAFVRVGITYNYDWILPLVPMPWDELLLPVFGGTSSFYTTLPIEAMGAT